MARICTKGHFQNLTINLSTAHYYNGKHCNGGDVVDGDAIRSTRPLVNSSSGQLVTFLVNSSPTFGQLVLKESTRP
jgi:hypothetical protein